MAIDPSKDRDSIETFNKFFVSLSGNGEVVIMNPPRGRMSKADALNLAAWITALTGGIDELRPVLEAVGST